LATLSFSVPKKIAQVFAKPSRYKCFHGGRGSGKSFSVMGMAAVYGAKEKLRILFTREYQNSLKDSVFSEVKNAIQSDELLNSCYEIGVNYIKGKNGTEFLFAGLHNNIESIKSMSQIDICVVEEAETVSEESWKLLIPTIRREGQSNLLPQSELWVLWNPKNVDSPVHKRFILNPPKNARIAQVNFRDNPWFPKVLEEERLDHYERDQDTYYNVWEGEILVRTEAQIFYKKWEVEDFKESDFIKNGVALYDGPYYGTDFGFSNDPNAFIRCFIYDDNLYITHEAGGKKIDLDDMVDGVYSKIPDYDRFKIRADCARPETISYLKKQGLNIEAAKKWSGSVEDGIAYIRKFRKIIVHSSCAQTALELKNYSYKVDRLSGDILRTILDADNHYIDALRYALDPMIQGKITMADALLMRKRNA
jgi:phage terminase large subunit